MKTYKQFTQDIEENVLTKSYDSLKDTASKVTSRIPKPIKRNLGRFASGVFRLDNLDNTIRNPNKDDLLTRATSAIGVAKPFSGAALFGPEIINQAKPNSALNKAANYIDKKATQITRIINAFFGWDFNSCEMLRSKGILHPIDFANACPDSQITSLHYHFPWLVKSLLRWSIFCSTTKRKPRLTLNWEPYLEIADNPDLSLDEKIEAYDTIAKEHFDVYRFHDFNEEHLGSLDEIALEFFQTQKFRDIIFDKVSSLYPEHEIEAFTDHFFGLVQFWCKTEKDRLHPQEK